MKHRCTDPDFNIKLRITAIVPIWSHSVHPRVSGCLCQETYRKIYGGKVLTFASNLALANIVPKRFPVGPRVRIHNVVQMVSAPMRRKKPGKDILSWTFFLYGGGTGAWTPETTDMSPPQQPYPDSSELLPPPMLKRAEPWSRMV